MSHAATCSDDLEAAGRPRGARWLGVIVPLRAGEAKGAVLFSAYAVLLLLCYYVLKTLREPLLLTGGTAALKSYAYAAVAAILLVLVPLYGVLFRRTSPRRLVRWITLFFAATLAVFYVLGRGGIDIGFAYYVWVGVFSVTILAQFWAHAAHTYDVDRGQRLFPVIMTGATIGGLAGPKVAAALFPVLGSWNLLLFAIALLLATLLLVDRSADAVQSGPRGPRHAVQSHPLGGLALVWRDEYLLLLALLAVLLNCVNTTGEYVLAELALRDAARQIAADPSLDKAVLIADFYGSYYFAVNTATVIFQVFLVGKLFRWIGARGALLVLPVVALVGYGLVAFLPVFAIVRAVKILENSTEYSIMNTVRHVLYLPLPAQQQFEGKTAIDTFFWRLGDVVQAGIVFAGLHWLDMDYRDFALLNMLLAVAWIVIAAEIGGRYEGNARRRAPRWRLPALGACAAAGFALVAVGLPRDAGAGDAPRLAEAAGAAWRAPQAVVAAAR